MTIEWGPFKATHGDCLSALRDVAEASVDSVVTDPPYGLTTNKKGGAGVASVNLESPFGRARIGTGNGAGGFMGQAWDAGVPGPEYWIECLRVLKPGGYLLAFGGTRTYHRLAAAIEDAGFEIRDQIGWAFGSGFPKSHNGEWGGTALKPAWEPICMARKPLIGTVEANWREHGTGALNIDGSRVPTEDSLGGGAYAANPTPRDQMWGAEAGNSWRRGGAGEFVPPAGRWPANLIHDGSDEVLAAFPRAPGQQGVARTDGAEQGNNTFGALKHVTKQPEPRGDSGSAARFFYCAKASRKDRNEGLEGMPKGALNWSSGTQSPGTFQSEGTDRSAENNHPTVKPTDLMRYLCRLVTPAGGLVLDPFMGSGSTGKAALLEGFRFHGIERERRTTSTSPSGGFSTPTNGRTKGDTCSKLNSCSTRKAA